MQHENEMHALSIMFAGNDLDCCYDPIREGCANFCLMVILVIHQDCADYLVIFCS